MLVVILKNENADSHQKWQNACESYGINFVVVDILRADFLDCLKAINPTFCLAQPPGMVLLYKRMFDERIFAIENYLGIKVFPAYHEIAIHENKNALAYFLEANDIPHPKTMVFYSKKEALDYIKTAKLPLVAKTTIGAAGSGVKILINRKQALKYAKIAFSKGISRRFGPNKKTGTPKSWFMKAVKSPDYFFSKLKEYKSRARDLQYGYIILQEYIEHNYEWRCVKIGESFFAYKKLKIGDKASGSKQFDYGEPPIEILDFTRNLCNNHNFSFMAIDLFYVNGKIYVNELQTIFGHKNSFICMVREQKGRYLYRNGNWSFEAGDFNTNESYNLRLSHILSLYNEKR